MLQQRTQRLQRKEMLPEGTCASSTHQELHAWGWETGLAWHGMAWHGTAQLQHHQCPSPVARMAAGQLETQQGVPPTSS